jgi:hypothetical protein
MCFFIVVLGISLVTLSPERASLHEPGLATGGNAEDCVAARADHDSLGVAEYGSTVEKEEK